MFKVNHEVNPNGASFHDTTLVANIGDLIEAHGEPTFCCQDSSEKVQYEWIFTDEEGEVFTLYSWKERFSLDEQSTIRFHIGSRSSKEDEENFKDWLKFELEMVKK